jgi:hypothetical protein
MPIQASIPNFRTMQCVGAGFTCDCGAVTYRQGSPALPKRGATRPEQIHEACLEEILKQVQNDTLLLFVL